MLCALAPNVQVLIAGRAVMGLGAAASEPGTLSMLRHLYPDAQGRSRAIGVWAGTSGFALAMGPVIGGVLIGRVELAGHLLVQPVSGWPPWSSRRSSCRRAPTPTAARVDTAGTLLGAGALAAFVFAIIDSESAGFGAADVIVLLCVSAVLAAAFVWRERRAPHPLLDLRFLRMPQFTTPNIVAFCTYFATFAIFFFTALYLVDGRRRVRLPAGAGVLADDGPDDRGLGAGGPLDGRCRAALVDHDRVPAAGHRAVPGRDATSARTRPTAR